ncbi:MAG TPA: hypothetical protein VIM33_05490 [Gaiellaceae bacterium]
MRAFLRLTMRGGGSRRGKVALSLWSVAMVAIGVVACATYVFAVELNDCFLGTMHGGIADSEGWAVLMGFLLFLVAAVAAVRWRRRLLLLLSAFLIAYAGGLVVLYEAAPTIWGNVHCTG